MLKWKKVDKQGRPARRNCNSFEEHDYVSNGELRLKIINNSFGYDKEPWELVTKKGNSLGKFKRLKDAKAYAETIEVEPEKADTRDKGLIKNLKAQLDEYEERINHYEKLNLEQQQKIDELDTQLLQYQEYVADFTTAIQDNICKYFCPNLGQPI